MKTYGIRGQVLWFAFGTWVGAAFAALLEIIVRKEFKQGPYFNDGSGIPAELAVLVPFSCVVAVPYAVWLWARTNRKGQRTEIPWVFPLFSGIAYLPLLFSMIPLLIVVAGQGQGAIIGTLIGAYVLGFPVFLAEICSRVARMK